MTDYDSELRSNMWKGQRDGNPDVEAELASADEEGEKVGSFAMDIGRNKSSVSSHGFDLKCHALAVADLQYPRHIDWNTIPCLWLPVSTILSV